MSQLTIQQTFELAVRQHQTGHLQEAETLYRQVLAQQPQRAEVVHLLGLIAHQTGRNEIAADLIRRAIALKPDDADAHSSLGIVFSATGRIDEAIASFRRAITLRPNFPEAHNNLGNTLRENGRLEEAIAAYRQTIVLRPNLADAHSNLGIALRETGKLDEAIAAQRRAISLKPDYAKAYYNLGNTLVAKGQLDEAIDAYRQAIAFDPKLSEAHNNLGTALREKRRFDEAIAAYRQAIALKPDYAEAVSNLGVALNDIGQIDQSLAAYSQAITLKPDYATAHSNLIFTLHYRPDYDARAIAQELGRWNHQHAQPLRKFIQPHSNNINPDRRLRIGYVSPDFKDHPVGRNLLPLFHHHDRHQFEIACYAHVLRPDAMTAEFQQKSDHWRNIVGVPDDQVAKQIREDRIDILIDLALHTAGNRLLVFAYKPAPVQLSYLGYCGSTGLPTIDYRISDPHLDPPGTDESSYAEKTIRLPRTYWSYQPGINPNLASAPAPALNNGFVTFGCQNNFGKLSSATWTAWIAILRGQANSKLLIYAAPGHHREAARKILADAGIDSDRLFFTDARGTEYFRCFNRIDIALDPFPFGGGTTTCDTLWMGVPVVTLSGATAVGRGGRSILSNLGLPELIAQTTDQYVQIALSLANDVDRTDALRRGMRARLEASPLMDAKGFTREMEAVYRQIWRTWCESPSPT